LARAGVCTLAGKFKAGAVLNGIVSHQDWMTTFLPPRRAQNRGQAPQRSQGRRKDLQGYLDATICTDLNRLEVKESPREFFFYISDDGDILAI